MWLVKRNVAVAGQSLFLFKKNEPAEREHSITIWMPIL